MIYIGDIYIGDIYPIFSHENIGYISSVYFQTRYFKNSSLFVNLETNFS